MTQAEKERAIACLRLAIELAGDGGMVPFTDNQIYFWNLRMTTGRIC